MRLVVHDYSGHPFQVQLSRELARRGHDVLHLHSASYVTGKGAVERLPDDPSTFAIDEIRLDEAFEAYSIRKRPFQERRYAQRLIARVRSFAPEVVISSNTPLFAQWPFQRACRRSGYRFVFWQQDVYSFPMRTFARERLPVVGGVVGEAVVALERRMAKASDAVVVISRDFVPVLDEWRVPRERVHVVENWAPLDELPLRSRDNGWARRHDLVDKRVALYAGTLGLKHDPNLLVELARRLQDDASARVVVVSGSVGAQWLHERADGIPNLVLLPFQPYEELPDVLGSADVVLAILEPDAGVFSVPSKILSYHCAGRPIVAAMPRENLGARIIEENGTGVVVPPGDARALADAVAPLLADRAAAEAMGARAREYAERTFDIRAIGDRFESIVAAP